MNKKLLLIPVALAMLALSYAVYAADTTAPSIELSTPADSATSYLNRTNFSYVVRDSSPILWCKLKFGDITQNITSSITVNTTNYFYNVPNPNGTINWEVSCSDNATNVGRASRVLYVNYDIKEPTVEINMSSTNVTEDGIASFGYTSTDYASGVRECRLYINDELNATTTSPQNNTTNVFTGIQLNPGTYLWGVNCTDNADNEGSTQIATLDVRTASNLTVELVAPADGAVSSTGTFDFQFIPRSNEYVTSCEAFFNDTLNLTTRVVPNVVNTFSKIKLNDGMWAWKVGCRTLNGVKRNSTERTVIARYEVLISTYISVTPQNPADNITDTSGIVTFSYIPKSISEIKKCELLTNNSIRATSESITNAALNNFAEIDLSDGTWNWQIRCRNADGRVTSSMKRVIKILRIAQEEPAEENLNIPATPLDIRALNEVLGPIAGGESSVRLLIYVILISAGFSFGVFVLSQDAYRKMIIRALKPHKVYAKEQLKTYIDRYLKKGISEQRIKRHLRRYNWEERDIEKAFEEVYGEMRKSQHLRKRPPLKPPPMPPKHHHHTY